MFIEGESDSNFGNKIKSHKQFVNVKTIHNSLLFNNAICDIVNMLTLLKPNIFIRFLKTALQININENDQNG